MNFLQVSGGAMMKFDPRVMRLKKMRKTIYNAGMGIQEELAQTGRRYNCHFVTLTYARVDAWEPNHIKEFLKRVRVWLWRLGEPCRYVWVGELQKRGALHYHLLFWIRKGIRFPKPDDRGWWKHGSTNRDYAKKGVGYLMKYCSKGDNEADHAFPRGCRIYGVGGLSEKTKRRVRWWRASGSVRRYFREQGYDEATCDLRKCKGGWVDKLTGLMIESEWRLLLIGRKKLVFYRITDLGTFDYERLYAFALAGIEPQN